MVVRRVLVLLICLCCVFVIKARGIAALICLFNRSTMITRMRRRVTLILYGIMLVLDIRLVVVLRTLVSRWVKVRIRCIWLRR